MKSTAKSMQVFIVTLNANVDTVLTLLKSDLAREMDIHVDNSVKILELEGKGKKFIPIASVSAKIFNKKILDTILPNIEFEILSLPWQDSWRKLRISTDLHDNLKNVFSPSVLECIPKSFDSIGNIAIIEIDRWGELTEILDNEFQLRHILKSVGNSILSLHKHIKTVLRKEGNIQGEFRIRKYEFLAGERDTSTLHRENNMKFLVDPTIMFFSPRLSYERKRVSSLQYKKDSKVLDCFAGCGPFSLQIAQNSDVNVYCIEKNLDAYTFLKKNITLNQKRIKGKIYPYLGDFDQYYLSHDAKSCLNHVDFIIMNLPERSNDFLPSIRPFLKTEGTYLVYYSFIKSKNPLQDAFARFQQALNQENINLIEKINSRIVFSYSPSQNNIVIDSWVKRK